MSKTHIVTEREVSPEQPHIEHSAFVTVNGMGASLPVVVETLDVEEHPETVMEDVAWTASYQSPWDEGRLRAQSFGGLARIELHNDRDARWACLDMSAPAMRALARVLNKLADHVETLDGDAEEFALPEPWMLPEVAV